MSEPTDGPAARKVMALWVARAEELLADGEWMDGRAFVKEVEKAIPPGPAGRVAEESRRGGSKMVLRRQIAVGKRAIVQTLVNARVANHSWEVDPWPIPPNGWRIGGWRLRHARVGYMALTAAAQQLGMAKETANRLVDEDPPIPLRQVGSRKRLIRIEDLQVLDGRRRDEWEAAMQGRIDRAHAVGAFGDRPWFTATDLRAIYTLANGAISAVQDQHPDLGWVWKGRRNSYLPAASIPAFEKALLEYARAGSDRRSVSLRRAHAERRARTEAAADQVDQVEHEEASGE